jgi:hypothetical protein
MHAQKFEFFFIHIKIKIEPWYKKWNEEEKVTKKQSHKSLKTMLRTR